MNEKQDKLPARRFVLYDHGHDGKYACVLEEWNGQRYVESEFKARHEQSLFALLDCKRSAMLFGQWQEQWTSGTPRRRRRRRSAAQTD